MSGRHFHLVVLVSRFQFNRDHAYKVDDLAYGDVLYLHLPDPDAWVVLDDFGRFKIAYRPNVDSDRHFTS